MRCLTNLVLRRTGLSAHPALREDLLKHIDQPLQDAKKLTRTSGVSCKDFAHFFCPFADLFEVFETSRWKWIRTDYGVHHPI